MMDFDFENQRDKSSSKTLARKSSIGCSSRISYYRSGEGVPFKWEMQPGIAKEAPNMEELPPLTPPPALLGLGLPKPCIDHPKSSIRSRLSRFWNKRAKRGNGKKPQESDFIELDISARSQDSCSDSDLMASPRGSSFSSSLHSTNSESPVREVYGRPFTLGCFPMHITRILVSIARRD